MGALNSFSAWPVRDILTLEMLRGLHRGPPVHCCDARTHPWSASFSPGAAAVGQSGGGE